MSRLRLALPALALGLAVSTLGCRAKPEACEALARHIGDVAASEGQGGASTVFALHKDCEAHPPSKQLVSCMMAAQTMAEISAC